MAASDTASRIGPYVERLVDNGYAQDNLRDAAVRLRDAYQRASKRRVKPTRDEKLRRQLGEAVRSMSEAGKALKSGRTKPKKRWGRRLAIMLGLGALGAAIAFARSEELRQSLGLGSDTSDSEAWAEPPPPAT